MSSSALTPHARSWWRGAITFLLALLIIGVPAAALAWYGNALVQWQRVGAWIALGLLSVAVIYRLVGGSLFGPILFYDLIRSARRGRHVFFRCLYLAALLSMLFLLYVNFFGSRYVTNRFGGDAVEGSWMGQRLSPNEMAEFANKFFETFVMVQFVVIVLLTPGCTAGAIAEEKERKTMDYLLSSDLRPMEIVLGKLTSRLAYLTLLLMTGLPVLGILQLLGGVDPQLVLAGFAATTLTMISLASLSIFNSVYCEKPRTAILLTYIEAGLYLVLANVVRAMLGNSDLLSQVLNSGNILAAISELRQTQAAQAATAATTALVPGTPAPPAPSMAATLTVLLRDYALFHGGVTIITLFLATAWLRVWSKWQASSRSKRSFAITFLPRRRARIGKSPMLWKEVYVEPLFRFGRWSMAIVGALVYGFVVLSAFAFFILFLLGITLGILDEAMNEGIRWVGTPLACLMLVSIALRSASSFSSERDRQTFDSLLSSPLTNEAILRAKWLGSLLSVRRLGYYLGFIWLLGLFTGGLHLLALPLLVGAWFIYAAFMCSVGMIFSLFCKTTTRATLWTLVTITALSVGHWLCGLCCGPLLLLTNSGSTYPYSRGGYSSVETRNEWVTEFQKYGLTPPFTLNLFTFYERELDNSLDSTDSSNYSSRPRVRTFTCGRTIAAFFGLGCYAMAAWVLWAISCEHFTRVTGRMPMPPEVIREEYARYLEVRKRTRKQQAKQALSKEGT